MSKFKEYQVVKNNKDLSNVPKGTLGTILIIYETNKDYEVEFVNTNGEFIETLTVNQNDLEGVDQDNT